MGLHLGRPVHGQAGFAGVGQGLAGLSCCPLVPLPTWPRRPARRCARQGERQVRTAGGPRLGTEQEPKCGLRVPTRRSPRTCTGRDSGRSEHCCPHRRFSGFRCCSPGGGSDQGGQGWNCHGPRLGSSALGSYGRSTRSPRSSSLPGRWCFRCRKTCRWSQGACARRRHGRRGPRSTAAAAANVVGAKTFAGGLRGSAHLTCAVACVKVAQ
mmetsp:Transcript_87875/g.188511  ORF Transcript_87875/g.188511 Transcript_87875/m.188511 type:complete len:211 (-) Transcript_87875:70-702(-)